MSRLDVVAFVPRDSAFTLVCLSCVRACLSLEQKVVIPEERKSVQKSVDSAIVSKLDAITTSYLRSKFTLTKGQYPHALTF